MRRVLFAALWILTLAMAFEVGRQRASRPAVGELSSEQMEQAVGRTLSNRDYFERNLELAQLLEGLSAENLPGVIRAYGEPPWAAGVSEIRLLMHAWARFDPLGAFEHARNWGKQKKKEALMAVAFAWAMRSPIDAMEAVRELGDDEFRESVTSSLVEGWIYSGYSGLDEFIASLPADVLRRRLTAVFVAEWLREENIEAVVEWVESLPEGKNENYKHTAFLRALNQIAALDHDRATAWVAAHDGCDYAAGAAEEVALKWVSDDADAAFEWLAGLEVQDEGDRAVFAGFRRWWNANPEAAEAWLRNTELAEIHDWALVVFARKLKHSSPEQAVEWSERIRDRELRVQSLAEIALVWRKTDAIAFASWLRTAEFPDEIRVEMQQQRSPPRAPRPRNPPEQRAVSKLAR